MIGQWYSGSFFALTRILVSTINRYDLFEMTKTRFLSLEDLIYGKRIAFHLRDFTNRLIPYN